MTTHNTSLVRFFLLVLTLAVRLTAAPPAEGSVTIQFTTFSFGEIADALHVRSDTGELHRLAFPYHSRGGPYTYQGPPTLEMFTLLQNEEEETVRGPTLARATVPPNVQRLLLIVVPVPGEEMKYRVLVFNEDTEVFPADTITLVNFFGSDLVAEFGKDKSYRIPSGKIERVKVDAWLNRTVTVNVEDTDEDAPSTVRTESKIVSAVSISLHANIQGRVGRIYHQVMRLRSGRRYIIFVFPNRDANNPGVMVRTLSEAVAVGESATPPP